MPHAGHEAQAVARIYAEALLHLAEEAGTAEAVLEELAAVEDLLDRVPELQALFASPLVDPETKAGLLDRHLRAVTAGSEDGTGDKSPATQEREDRGFSDLVVDTLQVMNRKSRLGLVHDLVFTYKELYEAARGLIIVRVVTAVPLSDSQRAAITAVAERVTAQTPRLEASVDPLLLGGVVLYAGDRKFDSSVRRELDEIADRLTERTSHEMHQGAGRYAEGEI